MAAVALGWEALLLAVAIPHRAAISWSPVIAIFTLSTLAVGWIIAWKRPRLILGWILLTIAILASAQGPTAAVGLATLHAAPRVTE